MVNVAQSVERVKCLDKGTLSNLFCFVVAEVAGSSPAVRLTLEHSQAARQGTLAPLAGVRIPLLQPIIINERSELSSGRKVNMQSG